MDLQISTYQLGKIVEAAMKRGASLVLTETGQQKAIMTLAEVRRLYGRKMSEELRMTPKIKWMPLGKGGTSSGVYCMREDLENYLMNKSLDDVHR